MNEKDQSVNYKLGQFFIGALINILVLIFALKMGVLNFNKASIVMENIFIITLADVVLISVLFMYKRRYIAIGLISTCVLFFAVPLLIAGSCLAIFYF